MVKVSNNGPQVVYTQDKTNEGGAQKSTFRANGVEVRDRISH